MSKGISGRDYLGGTLLGTGATLLGGLAPRALMAAKSGFRPPPIDQAGAAWFA